MGKRRVVSLLLAGAVLLVSFVGVLPVRAGAVLPVGLIESAFASYAVSSGYQFASAEADDNIFLGLFRELYDDFITVKEAAGQQIRSWDEYTDRDVYIDNSGQIVVSYGVAQDWAGAMEWIQSHYDIQDGGEAVEVVAGSGGDYVSGTGIVARKFNFSDPVYASNWGADPLYMDPDPIGSNYDNGSLYWWATSFQDSVAYMTVYNDAIYYRFSSSGEPRFMGLGYLGSNNYQVRTIMTYQPERNNDTFFYLESVTAKPLWWDYLPISTVDPTGYNGPLTASGGVAGMAASIANTVIDVAQGATEDDSLVIGVGAAAGSTAAEIAQEVASGIRAGTLEPAVTVTATDVIDTPVQPYPDIDGLGLPSLGAALVSRFPFCIPWDFVDTLKLVAVDPRPPVFDVDLVPSSIKSRLGITGNTAFHVDLSGPQYAKVFVAVRWGALVSFCLGLALLTKRLIWTA